MRGGLVATAASKWQIPAVSERRRILGLDVGARRIGVAVSDELGLCAHPLTVLERQGTKKDVARIARLCAEQRTDHVVVGIPTEPDGEEGHRAARVRVLMTALAESGLVVDECDEQYSTVEAEEVLLEADMSRARRKRVIDRAAAAVILDRWLAERAAAAAEAAARPEEAARRPGGNTPGSGTTP